MYPYSGSVYTNSSLIKPNDIELASYFDNNIGEPQRQTDRENLHDQFKEVYEKVKAAKAKKKKISTSAILIAIIILLLVAIIGIISLAFGGENVSEPTVFSNVGNTAEKTLIYLKQGTL